MLFSGSRCGTLGFDGGKNCGTCRETAKLAVIKSEKSVTVVPWRPALEAMRGQRVQGIMHPPRVV